MAQYVPVPSQPTRAGWDGWSHYFDDKPTITVYEADMPASSPTGLYDADGTPLHRVNERNPIGFRIR